MKKLLLLLFMGFYASGCVSERQELANGLTKLTDSIYYRKVLHPLPMI